MPGSRPAIDAELGTGGHILVDTSVLIAYLDGREAISLLSRHILEDLVKSGQVVAVVSMVTVMELLVRPVRQGPSAPYQHIMDFLSTFPNIRLMNIDLFIAQEAANLRSVYKLNPADALVIASGIIGQVGHLVTNDHAWQTKLNQIVQAGRLNICYLGNYLPFP